MEFEIRPVLEIALVLASVSGLTFLYFRGLRAIAAGLPAFVRGAREMRGLRTTRHPVAAPTRARA